MSKKKIKKLIQIRKKKGGRDNRGRISVRHQGGEHKRFVRTIDWKRDKKGIKGQVESIDYDPNRQAYLALILYADGERRYILAPEGLKKGGVVVADDKAEPGLGNALKLKNIPVGVPIHNLEIRPGKGGQIVRGAGGSAFVQGKEGGFVVVKLPSGEIRRFVPECQATIGQVGNIGWGAVKLKKAGDKRRRGIRPTVRGVAQHPDSHPHGGGEGRSPIGMKAPKTPWGKKTLGKKTRKKKKYSDKLIISRGKK
ncbi:50S ribosomal protein L2 [Candidatus Shapirobacteria bacterium]|nr:50S ribosomal protein L2 [Candidatus Shapirobacteria bacterium]